jgi:hypothetical protein
MLFEAVTGRLLFGFIGTGLTVPFVVGASRVVTLERLGFVLIAVCIFAPDFPSTQRHTAARLLATRREQGGRIL